MAFSEDFLEYTLEQLHLIEAVRTKKMFGGVGIYSGDHFFALIAEDQLYFKTDEQIRDRYDAAGMEAFKPFESEKTTMNYHQVPAEVFEDPELLAQWALLSIDVAIRKPPKKRKPKKSLLERR